MQDRAIKKLQALVKSLEGQINSKDAALLAAVEKLVGVCVCLYAFIVMR